MKIKKISKKFIIAFFLPLLIIFDLILCFAMYLFAPVSYNAPDLHKSNFSFELYSKYTSAKNPSFYIKQLKHADILSVPEDVRVKYVDNTILLIAEDNAAFDEISGIVNSYNGRICGYIENINFYQVEFSDKDYEELLNMCSVFDQHNLVKIALVDYFEEMPINETSTSSYSDAPMEVSYYYDMINYPYEIYNYTELTSSVSVGILDVLIDSESDFLNIVNKNTYSANWLNNELLIGSSSHGTHVAGILAASQESNAPAICPKARIISDNGINNSLSYWIAAITDMIVNYNVKVINMSMGYNTYIPISATLGCAETIEFIDCESNFFEAVLSNLITDGYEFLICVAAGNETGATINRIKSSMFSYGDQNMLNSFDIFNIFTEKPLYCDAKYNLPFTAINDKNVREHIMVVGSCTENQEYSSYSNAGKSIDIVAPGEFIYSLGINDEYEFNSGTSMATPFVSGTAALLFAFDNTLTASEVKNIIINSSTENISAYGYEYPLLNIGAALDYISGQ